MTPGSTLTTTAAAPAAGSPATLTPDPGDVCLCTLPNGATRSVEVLAFRSDGKADVRGIGTRTDRMTVSIDWLTPLTH